MKKALIILIVASLVLFSCGKDGICDLHSGVFGEDDEKQITNWSGNITLQGMTCDECEAKRDVLRKNNGKYPIMDIRDGKIVPINSVIYCQSR